MFPDDSRHHDELTQYHWGLHAAGLVLCGLILGGAYAGVLGKLRVMDEGVKADVDNLQAFLDQKDNFHADHRQARSRLAQQEGRLEELLQRIPDAPQESEFLAQLSKLGLAAGMDIRQFSPGDATSLGEHSMLEVELVAESSYPGLCRFLEGLQSLPRLCQVAALDIQVADPSTLRYPVKITLRIFFAPMREGPPRRSEPSHA